MKHLIFIFIAASSISSAQNYQNTNIRPTGEIPPELRTEPRRSDLKKYQAQLDALKQPMPQPVEVGSLFSEQDRRAIALAKEGFKKNDIAFSEYLMSLAALQMHLSADLGFFKSKSSKEKIIKISQERFEYLFNEAPNALVTIRPEIISSINSCESLRCLGLIQNGLLQRFAIAEATLSKKPIPKFDEALSEEAALAKDLNQDAKMAAMNSLTDSENDKKKTQATQLEVFGAVGLESTLPQGPVFLYNTVRARKLNIDSIKNKLDELVITQAQKIMGLPITQHTKKDLLKMYLPGPAVDLLHLQAYGAEGLVASAYGGIAQLVDRVLKSPQSEMSLVFGGDLRATGGSIECVGKFKGFQNAAGDTRIAYSFQTQVPFDSFSYEDDEELGRFGHVWFGAFEFDSTLQGWRYVRIGLAGVDLRVPLVEGTHKGKEPTLDMLVLKLSPGISFSSIQATQPFLKDRIQSFADLDYLNWGQRSAFSFAYGFGGAIEGNLGFGYKKKTQLHMEFSHRFDHQSTSNEVERRITLMPSALAGAGWYQSELYHGDRGARLSSNQGFFLVEVGRNFKKSGISLFYKNEWRNLNLNLLQTFRKDGVVKSYANEGLLYDFKIQSLGLKVIW